MIDLMCVSLSIDMSDDEIKECIQKLFPLVQEHGKGFCFSINGFDEDSRALWEIPEALDFLKRLSKFGFCSLLEPSTSCEAFFPSGKLPNNKNLPGFGALEVWLCITDRMKKGEMSFDKKVIDTFFSFLKSSNGIVETIISLTPYQTGLQLNKKNYGENNRLTIDVNKSKKIPDAPVRHHGIRHYKWNTNDRKI